MILPRHWIHAFISATCLTSAAFAAEGPYHFIREIPVGGSAQWDYLTIDADSHRLYLPTPSFRVLVYGPTPSK